jgi:DNA-binding GntR family transcriptional regulator
VTNLPHLTAAEIEKQSSRLRRKPLGNQIAETIREDILLGRLSSGTVLSQQRLCEEFGTSRMPVRDALRQLTSEGLIVSTPSGHSHVAGLTSEDIRDAYYVEGSVHGRMARRAAANATPADLATLRALHDQMVDAEHRDLREVANVNWRFHRLINVLAASPKLLACIRTVSLSIPREYLLEMPEWATRTNGEHAEILSAFEARDLNAVEARVRAHVENAGTNLIDYLARRTAANDGVGVA